MCRQGYRVSDGAVSPWHSQAGETARTLTRCKERPSDPAWHVTGSSPAPRGGGKGKKGEGWPWLSPPAGSGAERTTPLRAVQVGDSFRAGKNVPEKVLFPSCFPKTKEAALHCWKSRARAVLACYHPITRRPGSCPAPHPSSPHYGMRTASA